jgi:hypothetical protein
MAQRFSVIQGGLAADPKGEPGRTRREVADRVGLHRPASPSKRPPIPAQAFVAVRPKDWAPEAA